MARKEDFFIKENAVVFVPNEEYALIDIYVQFFDAFARTTYKSIYVIDYHQKKFLYVSDNQLFLCGVPAEKVREMGYDFYLHFVPEAELSLLLEINRAGFMFAETIPSESLLEYTLSYDFHIIPQPGKLLLINHKITPLRLTRQGKVWLALCTVSISSQTKTGNVEVTRKGYSERWRYSIRNRKWRKCAGFELKEIEKDVLRLSMQGYTMKEISGYLFKSVDSIKTYKRQIFEKLETDNITEAISFAINKNLL